VFIFGHDAPAAIHITGHWLEVPGDKPIEKYRNPIRLMGDDDAAFATGIGLAPPESYPIPSRVLVVSAEKMKPISEGEKPEFLMLSPVGFHPADEEGETSPFLFLQYPADQLKSFRSIDLGLPIPPTS